MAMYHWETDQEDFLVVSGEALLIIEGDERSLRQWDFVHCPPQTKHAIVGAGDVASVIFAAGAREHHTYRDADGVLHGKPDWGSYAVDEAALRHRAGVTQETTASTTAYADFTKREPMPYRDGRCPGSSHQRRGTFVNTGPGDLPEPATCRPTLRRPNQSTGSARAGSPRFQVGSVVGGVNGDHS